MQLKNNMQVLKTNKLTCFDVDGTLLIHDPIGVLPLEKTLCWPNKLFIGDCKWIEHKRHVQQLIASKARGHTVWVWSAGGVEWAEQVIKLLGLEQYVDYVSDKPHWEYEDDPSWHRHVYYKPEDMEPR